MWQPATYCHSAPSGHPCSYFYLLIFDFLLICFLPRGMQCNAQYCCRNSVCPSVRCVYCDKTKWCTADAISLSNIPRKRPTPFEKRWLRQISAYNVSTIRDSEKTSYMTNIKSTTGFPTSYKWSAYVTLSRERGGSKSEFFRFFGINVNFSWIKSATKFLCVKTSSGKVVVRPFSYFMVHRYWRESNRST